MESFTGLIQTLMETHKDFPKKFKQRLVAESSNVTSPFGFIAGLLDEGVLCDGSSEPEAVFGLKEIMVQLAITIASAKGTEAIAGLLKALVGSGNFQLISTLNSWAKENFAVEFSGDLSESKGINSAPLASTLQLFKQVESANESNSSGTELVEMSKSQQQEGSLATNSQARKKNLPAAVRIFAGQAIQMEQHVVKSAFFEQAAPLNDLEKVATFNTEAESSTMGTIALEFDKERMVAYFANGTLKLWNWAANEERNIAYGDKLQLKASDGVTSCHYDEEILVLGTAKGTVHLFDARELKEKWSVRLGEPVHLLKFFESTLTVLTRGLDGDKCWWLDISRSDMRLRNPRSSTAKTKTENSGFLIDPVHSFLYNSNFVTVHDTKSGTIIHYGCWLEAPADISTLNLVDLISSQSIVVAGCKDGTISMWNNYLSQVGGKKPARTFEASTEPILCLGAIYGHLLSVDERGKLLMWSGYDLGMLDSRQPVPRVLADNFYHVTSLAGIERWFASGSSKDGIIKIWALPDLWLRTG